MLILALNSRQRYKKYKWSRICEITSRWSESVTRMDRKMHKAHGVEGLCTKLGSF